MPEIREKLIEILRVPIHPHLDADPVEVVADYLIANGVTFATDNNDGSKWIPASDPPKNSGIYIVMIQGARKATTLVYTIQHKKWVDEVMDEYRVTHWMEMPQPPKEDS